jgi:hypothetical protein
MKVAPPMGQECDSTSSFSSSSEEHFILLALYCTSYETASRRAGLTLGTLPIVGDFVRVVYDGIFQVAVCRNQSQEFARKLGDIY